MVGFKLAAHYSFPPSDLKLCGVKFKDAPQVLTQLIQGKEFEDEHVRPIFESFEAAFPYYQLIARKNNIMDPFEHKVVEAYWIGNELLTNIKTSNIKDLILKDFKGPGLLSDELSLQRAAAVPQGAIPHHSFHVLILGSVTGRVQFHGNLFDLCCINSGKVIQKLSDKLIIESPKLVFENNRFFYTKPVQKKIDWNKQIIPHVSENDIVTTHWNQACEIIDKDKQERIRKYTQFNIDAITDFN